MAAAECSHWSMMWKTKNGIERTSGRERTGLTTPFVPIGWWEVAILGRGAADSGDE
jgi:hypothetical protein